MALDCSLIKPNFFEFNAVGCDNPQINNRCANKGTSRIVLDIDMPVGSNSAIAHILLLNTRTQEKHNHNIGISEYKCSCPTLCVEDTGFKKNYRHTITIIFNDLIPGDRHIGSACLEYIL